MTEPNDFEALEARLRERMRQEADSVPDDVAIRLAAARRRAVAEFEELPPAARWLRFWFASGRGLGALGATAAVALAVGLLLRGDDQVGTLPSGLVLADEAEIAAAQEVELLSELEFLAWLEADDVDAG